MQNPRLIVLSWITVAMLSGSSTLSANAAPKTNLTQVLPKRVQAVCQRQVQDLLNGWGADPSVAWKALPTADGSGQVFRKPGRKLGDWVTLYQAGPDRIRVFVEGEEGRYGTDFSSRDCEGEAVAQVLVKPKSEPSSKFKWFTDKDLEKLLEDKKNGLIYVWSPHMTLSVRGISEIAMAAQDLGLPVDLVMDAMADDGLAHETLKKNRVPASDGALKRLRSRALIGMNANLHYPTLILYKDKKVCGTLQRGHRSREIWRQIAESILSRCES